MAAEAMHGDPVAAITEAEATGETAEIFADLRATLGVNVVNLIWRHFATFPGALPWAWATVKPVYVAGQVGVEGLRIKAGLTLPVQRAWPRALLACAGVDAEAEVSIRRILASYNRSNAMNLAALSALVRRIDGTPISASSESLAEPQQEEPVIGGAMPRLLSLDEVTPDTADLVGRINLLGDRAEGRILASMYRHLAHWPGFLALCYVQLQAQVAAGRLDELTVQTLALASVSGSRLQAGLADLPAPDTVSEVHRSATDFIQHAIGKMVPVVAVLMAVMPE